MVTPKIPKNMLVPPHGWDRYGLQTARRALEIQAAFIRQGEPDVARTLRQVASCLKAVEKGTPVADAFGWPIASE